MARQTAESKVAGASAADSARALLAAVPAQGPVTKRLVFLPREYETRLRRRGVGTERVLMVGTGSTSELLIRRMNMFPQYGYLCCGVADDQLEVGSQFAGVSVVGRPDDLPHLAEALQIDK